MRRCLVIFVTVCICLLSGSRLQAAGIKYYGVDRGNPITDANYSILAQHAVNTIIVETDINGGVSLWQNIVNLAAKYKFNVVIWPADWNATNWPNCNWETPYIKNRPGDYIAKVKPLLDAIGGNPSVIGIVNAHEPFWSCLMTIQEMADIRTQLKNYVKNKFGRDIQVWNYVDNIAENHISGPDIARIMDVAVIWQHCFGGAEGTCDQAEKKIMDDRNAIKNAGLNGKVELVYLFQTFAMSGGYRMPTATEMYDWGCRFLKTGVLDGFMYYSWGACWYSRDLWCPAPTHPARELWPIMNRVYDECAGGAPNTPPSPPVGLRINDIIP
jgi:hypothetical protein